MVLIVVITLISAVLCSRNESINILKEIDKNALDLKVAEKTTDIVFMFKSGDYLPIFGSWYDGNNLIAFNHSLINEENVCKWLDKNITDHDKLIDFLNTFGNVNFEFKISKRNCEESNYNFEFRVEVIRKKDLNNILSDYLKGISSTYPSNEDFKTYRLVEVAKNCLQKEITCSFKFAKNFSEMPDFSNYEFTAYEIVTESNIKKNNSKKELDCFKQTLINIGKHTLVSLAIVGPYALILHFVLAKYIIKQ